MMRCPDYSTHRDHSYTYYVITFLGFMDPPSPPTSACFSTKNKQKLAFSDPPSPLQVLTQYMNGTLKTISLLTSLMKWSIKMLFITIVRIRFKQGGRG